jgi:hypothetical protein
MDAPRERGRRGQAGRRIHPPGGRELGGRQSRTFEGASGKDGPGIGAGRPDLRGTVRPPSPRPAGRAQGDPLGRRVHGGRHRDRPHSTGGGDRGLRARPGARPPGAGSGGRGRALLRRLRLAARPGDRRVGRTDRGRPGGAGPPGGGGGDRPPVPALLAMPDTPDLPRGRRLVHRRGRTATAVAEGERHRELDPRLHGQADGRLAPQHGRLEHLPAPVLRAAPALLSVHLRPSHRDRVQTGAGDAGIEHGRPRSARGAAPAVDRRRDHPVRVVRERRQPDPRGRRRVARRGDCSVLHPRVGEPGVDRGRVCHRGLEGALHRRSPGPLLLGEVVPCRLGLGDARAGPPVVLLPAVHVGGAHGAGTVQGGAGVREDAR